MRIKLYHFLLCSGLLFVNCKEKTVETVDPRTFTDTLKIRFTDSLRVQTQLLPESVKVAEEADAYTMLAEDLQKLNRDRIGVIKTKIDGWIDAANELRETFEGANTNKAIDARLIVLSTKANVLKQEIDKREIDTAIINQEATEFYNAFQDLALQLNLKFGKSIDELLEDFRKESQKRRIEAQEEKARTSGTDTASAPKQQ